MPKKKFKNISDFPDHVIEFFARTVFEDVIAASKDPEILKEYEEYLKHPEMYDIHEDPSSG